MKANAVLANSIGEVESILNDVTAEKGGGKFVMAHVKNDPGCDLRVKEFKATVRCIPLSMNMTARASASLRASKLNVGR